VAEYCVLLVRTFGWIICAVIQVVCLNIVR